MQVALRHREEFIQALKTYSPSAESLSTLQDIPLVLLQGVAASGRNAIINRLSKNGNYQFVISDTTRPPKLRDGKMEQDGVQYYVRSEEDMLADIKNGLYLEAELIHNQQVSGISIRELMNAHKDGLIPINEVAREGVQNVYRLKPNTKVLFVTPPSYDVWMDRWTKREESTAQELENRKESAKREITDALAADYYTFVVNDDLDKAVEQVDRFIRLGKPIPQEHARQVARGILERL